MQRLLLSTAGVLLLTTLSGAQNPEQSWENLRTLRVGERIQVVDQRMRSETGTFAAFSQDALVFYLGADQRTIPREDVLRITLLERTQRGRNALVGLGIGALAGAAFLGIAAASDSWFREEAGLFAAGGAVLGGGVGAGVGALFPGRPTVYRAERRQELNAP